MQKKNPTNEGCTKQQMVRKQEWAEHQVKSHKVLAYQVLILSADKIQIP